MSLRCDVRTHRHFHSLSICSNGLSHHVHMAPCTGARVRAQGCLTWMWPPTRVNNYRITSIFIAFLLR